MYNREGEMLLKEVIKLFKQIQETSSTNDKKAIIAANKDNEVFKKCLVFLLDGNINTGISNKKINKKVEPSSELAPYYLCRNSRFEEIMNYLIKNNTGTDADIYEIQSFLVGHEKDREFYEQMITKSFRLGADSKVVNACIPGLIPTFEIQLGTSIEKCKLVDGTYISISHKMNGTRCVFLNGQMKSRQNKLYSGLDHIVTDIQKLGLEDFFIDGELVYKNEEGLSDSDAFQKGCSIAMSKDNDKSQLKLVVFDIFPKEEFLNLHTSKKTYKERRKDLDRLEESIKTSNITNLSVVERLYEGIDHSQIWKWLDYADEDMGWEGIVINLDTPYECKRTKNLIKVKRFFEKDLRCTKVNIATTGKYKGIMGSITCNYFDNTVDVGSGFNDSQREYFAKHPEEIVGKIVSVKYKEETQNKDGGKSLQFPVYMGILVDRDKAVDE